MPFTRCVMGYGNCLSELHSLIWGVPPWRRLVPLPSAPAISGGTALAAPAPCRGGCQSHVVIATSLHHVTAQLFRYDYGPCRRRSADLGTEVFVAVWLQRQRVSGVRSGSL